MPDKQNSLALSSPTCSLGNGDADRLPAVPHHHRWTIINPSHSLGQSVIRMYCLEAKSTPKKSIPVFGAISQHFTANHR